MFHLFFLFEFEIFGVKIENNDGKKSNILINFADQSSCVVLPVFGGL